MIEKNYYRFKNEYVKKYNKEPIEVSKCESHYVITIKSSEQSKCNTVTALIGTTSKELLRLCWIKESLNPNQLMNCDEIKFINRILNGISPNSADATEKIKLTMYEALRIIDNRRTQELQYLKKLDVDRQKIVEHRRQLRSVVIRK